MMTSSVRSPQQIQQIQQQQAEQRQQPILATSPSSNSSSNSSTSGSWTSRILGSGSAGVLELLLFHPVDTIAKRLMSFESRVIIAGDMSLTMGNLNTAIFTQTYANSSIGQKYASLFPGISFGAAYKILQRVYKFGGQPIVRDYLTKNTKNQFDSILNPKQLPEKEKLVKTIIYATAGSIMGIGEIFLLPLDVLKIKAQTNPESLKGRGLVSIIREEGMGLYRGAGWTAARNAPGSFALFGGSAFMKDYVFKLEKYSDATFLQDSLASVTGACASITVAQPLDIIKTRIQKRDFKDKTSGMKILIDMVKNEGFGAFFKGLTPKLLVVGPKLIFSFTIAQQLMAFFDQRKY